MVQYNNAYKGSVRTPVIKVGNIAIKEVYKGSELIYKAGFDPVTFTVSGYPYFWSVPMGITKIHIDCVASSGYGGNNAGKGGRVQCDLNVTNGQELCIMVGGIPTVRQTRSYNASDVRINGTELEHRIIIAGGGGSQGAGTGAGRGGNGGDLTSEGGANSGCCHGGYSATQTSGGAGGNGIAWTTQQTVNGASGTLGFGGNGAVHSGIGGAGGAGYYGGGGGCGGFTKKAGNYGGGGAGGSSYTHPTLCSNVVHTQGYMNGNGYVTISMA